MWKFFVRRISRAWTRLLGSPTPVQPEPVKRRLPDGGGREMTAQARYARLRAGAFK